VGDFFWGVGQDQFDGSWTIYDCGLAGALMDGLYERFLLVVQDEQERTRRLKRVGIWSIRSMSKAILQAWSHAVAMPSHVHSAFYKLYPLT